MIRYNSRNPNRAGDPKLLVAASVCLVLAIAFLGPLFASGCASHYQPATTISRETHPAAEIPVIAQAWRNEGGIVSYPVGHSMEPVIKQGDTVLLVMCVAPSEVEVGQFAVVDERNAFDHMSGCGCVLHEVMEISRDGKFVRMEGIHNPTGDGWFPISRVRFIATRILAKG